jgi:hypothetical protein
VVPPAVQELVFEEVDEVNKEFVAGGTGETRRVPDFVVPSPGGKHSHGSPRYHLLALSKKKVHCDKINS